ncbi:MAG TPA: dipeptide epimerase [Gammaproteobacteria bacterium]|jgi:L-alanine-DL-glutamate epimerase-like enolase superfamily enzyme|nr:dipeptide epimerase [Gammaproteobacteria bacterium]
MQLTLSTRSFPIAGTFTISRGSKTQADVVEVTLSDGQHQGRGECVPYARYGESMASVTEQIASQRDALANGLDREALQSALPAGAARNALDCALWDLAAKQCGQRIWEMTETPPITGCTTAYTLSLDTPAAMHENARAQAHLPLLKLKLSGPDDLDRVRAVRDGAPASRIILDANEGWTAADYTAMVSDLTDLGVEMIEQPLPADDDEALANLPHPIPLCADESCHDTASLSHIIGRYEMVNIKLDKTGGLTEALRLATQARAAGLTIMVGCMVSSSLSMAPAMVLAQTADVVDLDGPLILAQDRCNAIHFDHAHMQPPSAALWG